MTCIVGIVDTEKNNVVIGGDSAASNGAGVFIITDSKVFKNSEFIFGCTSSFRMIQLLKYSFKPPKVKNKDIYKYMCTDFINGVRKCFTDGGYIQRDTDGSELGGFFLVGYKNRLFKVEQDFHVSENLNGVNAVGCGGNYALGSLLTCIDTNMSSNEKVLKSLEVAEFLSEGVRGPFVLMNT